MTRMARSIGLSLAVPLLGRTWISRLGPNTRLTPATRTGNEDCRTAVPTAAGRKEGDPHGHHRHHRTRDLHRWSRRRSHLAGELGNPARGAVFVADPPGSGPGEPGNPPRDR